MEQDLESCLQPSVSFPTIRQSCLCPAPLGLAAGLGAPWQTGRLV